MVACKLTSATSDRLSSFCCNTKMVAPLFLADDIRRRSDNMKGELESALRSAGLPGSTPICFFVKDNVVTTSEILVHINEILQGDFEYFADADYARLSPYVLFDASSRSKIIEEMMDEHRLQSGEALMESAPTDAELWKRFIDRALGNLHIVFCLDTQAGLGCLSDFPIFARKCGMNVFLPSGHDGRIEIVQQKLAGIQFHEDERIHDKLHYALVHATGSFYDLALEVGLEYSRSLRDQYAIGLSQHLDLVNHFVKTRDDVASFIETRTKLLETCIRRVQDLKTNCEHVEANQVRWENEIVGANKEVEELVVVLGQKSTVLDGANENNKALEARARNCLEDLNRATSQLTEARGSVEPGFKGASADLRSLDRVLLGELKSYNTPPPAVERVMCIAIILSTPASKGGAWDLSWPRAKRTISSADRFIMDLLTVDPETISRDRLEAVKPYLHEADQFTPIIQEVSEVLGIVWDWMTWFFEYVKVHGEKITPLEKERDELQAVLDVENQALQIATQNSKQIEQEIVALSAKFENASSKKSRLQNKAKQDSERYHNAMSLIGKLEGEVQFWEEEVQELMRRKQSLLGDSLLGSAFLAYSGPLSQNYRKILFSKCSQRLQGLGIPLSSSLEPVSVYLRSDTEYTWYDQGLPILNFGARNTQVLENCVISKNRVRCPMFIDPDSIALNWCRVRSTGAKEDSVQLISYGHGLKKKLEASIQAGMTVLCTIVPQQIDPLLHCLLQMRILKKATANFLQIGKDMIEIGVGFALMLRTSCTTPAFPSAVTSRSTMINFRMDDDDFEDCILAMVVSAHNRLVRRGRDELLRLMVHRQVSVIRDKKAVIDTIINMSGDLSDSAEVEKIISFKTTVDTVREKLSSAEEKMAQMRRVASLYAAFARVLTASRNPVRSLAHLDSSYAFSSQELLHAFNMQLTHGNSGQESKDEQEEGDELESSEVSLGMQEEDAMEKQIGGVPRPINLQDLAFQSFAVLAAHVSHRLSRHHQHAFLVHSFFEFHVASGKLARQVYSGLLNENLSRADKLRLMSTQIEPFLQIYSELAQLVERPLLRGSLSQPSSVHTPWQLWVDSDMPEELEPPEEAQSSTDALLVVRLNQLEKLLLIFLLRPDRAYAAVRRELNRVLPSWRQLDRSQGGIEDVLLLQTSCNQDMHEMDTPHRRQFLPTRLKYSSLVPVLLLTARDMDVWSDILSVGVERKLLTPDTSAQSRVVLSATNPDLPKLLFDAARTDTWVLVKDVALESRFCELVDQWLESLAHFEIDPAPGSLEDGRPIYDDSSVPPESPDHPSLKVSPLRKPPKLDGHEHTFRTISMTPGGSFLPRPHPNFRLFISTTSWKGPLPFQACLWSKCIKLNCENAPVGIKANYLKLSKGILRGR